MTWVYKQNTKFRFILYNMDLNGWRFFHLFYTFYLWFQVISISSDEGDDIYNPVLPLYTDNTENQDSDFMWEYEVHRQQNRQSNERLNGTLLCFIHKNKHFIFSHNQYLSSVLEVSASWFLGGLNTFLGCFSWSKVWRSDCLHLL